MYTSPNATREKALAAAAAASRAMKRVVCCKSQFKFKCFSCGEMIQRGDKITMVHGGEGMTLRFRGSDCQSGLKQGETVFYQPSTGTKRWVHIGCNPCHWHSGGSGYGEPRLYGVWTEWAAKIQSEFDEDYALTGRWDMEEFLERNGYPQEKYQSDRVKAGVTKFQALWRGYIYKMALPYALDQRKAKGRIAAHNFFYYVTKRFTNPPPPQKTSFVEGEEGEILFDEDTPDQTIFSFKVIHKWASYTGGINYVVNFHSEPENFKNYSEHRLCVLTHICKEYKTKVGIEEKVTGKLNTAHLMLTQYVNNPPAEDWRYHYSDGTPVE